MKYINTLTGKLNVKAGVTYIYHWTLNVYVTKIQEMTPVWNTRRRHKGPEHVH